MARSPNATRPLTGSGKATQEFLRLVEQVQNGKTARGENDLSSKLAAVLEEQGLHTVIDTSGAGSRKRPDILAYVSQQDADLVLPAEVVIESKQPEEVEGFNSIGDAIVSDQFWASKTYPYLRDNIARVRYFAFTSFTDFAVFPVTESIRKDLVRAFAKGETECQALRQRIRRAVVAFAPGRGWSQWLGSHLSPDSLEPPPLSETRNSVPVTGGGDLDRLAGRLATLAAGMPDSVDSGLFQSIRAKLPEKYADLPDETSRDLTLFVMTQHPGFTPEQATKAIGENVDAALNEFVAASIHSLLSRLFAVKAIEDVFSIDQEPPLIEKDLWLFATDAYDGFTVEQIRAEMFSRIRRLGTSANPIVQRLAGYGSFFNWIESYIDPVLFRCVIEVFSVHNFTGLEGDLLGRFYELYAQQLNRARRKALGQYYTPLPVVRFMWHLAAGAAQEAGKVEELNVLDPAMGSATFLAEGARTLAGAGVPEFWDRLTGFDISAQVLGIAHVNLYMAVLSQLDPSDVPDVSDLRLYATDALDYQNGNFLRQLLPLMVDDIHRHFLQERVRVSTQAKQAGCYRLVIGNPPYKNNSSLTLAQVAGRFPRLLSSSVASGGAQRRNIRDDYAWFVAAADYYIGDQGMVCFILSDSFATHQSYEHFRAELVKQYHVRCLVRLGISVFTDVGYRTSFAVILLEKRAEPLDEVEDTDPIPYTDLRERAAGATSAELGTPADPRFTFLNDVVAGRSKLPCHPHTPRAECRYSLYPTAGADRLTGRTAALYERGDSDRLFSAKWSGVITAFDPFLSAESRESLGDRVESLFNLCRRTRSRNGGFDRALAQWAKSHGIKDDETGRLREVVEAIRGLGLAYSAGNIKRTFSGTLPGDARWYPPAAFTHYLYYEPRFRFQRNTNEGREVGWGAMNQWRDPRSHAITPKLIYTTASDRRNGYVAFVVDDEWCVKLHGGKSQQFNYTGLVNPMETPRLDRLPNNLMPNGIELFEALQAVGCGDDALLFYVAGVWNSAFAAELLEGGSSVRPAIRMPQNKTQIGRVQTIVTLARRARDLARIAHWLPTDRDECPASQAHQWADPALYAELGFTITGQGRKGFRTQTVYKVPDNIESALVNEREASDSRINEVVDLLYS